MAKHKNITEPDKHGFQVRIVCDGREYSRYFSHQLWGDKNKSLAGAQNWRDQMHVILGTHRRRLHKKPLASKRSTGVCGVSRSVQYDKRRDTSYLVYKVHWKDKDQIKNKSFHVGQLGEVTADQEFHAFRTAVLFRKEYECSVEDGVRFQPERYQLWKEKRLYEQ